MSTFADVITTVTAVASAVAAGAAWKSASASSSASKDARESLALNIQPHFNVRAALAVGQSGAPTGIEGILVSNVSNWPAIDVHVEIRYRDGHVEQHAREYLSPVDGIWTVPVLGVQIAGPDSWGDYQARIASVAVIFSDDRNIARYEQALDAIETIRGPTGVGRVRRLR